MKKRRNARPGLVDELQRSHRFTVAVLVSVLVLSLATSGYLILVSQPRLANYVELAREARDIHEAMLDQETGLRGWLATGDPVFLQPYREGRAHATERGRRDLLARRAEQPRRDRPRARPRCWPASEWQNWASEAAQKRFTADQRTDGTLTRTSCSRARASSTPTGAKDTISTDAIRARRTEALAAAEGRPGRGLRQLPRAARRIGRRHLPPAPPPAGRRARADRRPARHDRPDPRRRPDRPHAPDLGPRARRDRLRARPAWRPSSTTPAPRPRPARSGSRSWPTGSRPWSGSDARSPAA